MPPGLIDTGFSDALSRGMALGLSSADQQADREMRRRAMVAQQAQQERQDALARERMGNDRTRIGLAAEALRMKAGQTRADQRAGLSMFDALDTAPVEQPDPHFMPSSWQDEARAPRSGVLGIARDAFAEASPDTQMNLLAPTLQDMRARKSAELGQNIRRQAAEAKLNQGLMDIESSNLPEPTKEKMRLRLKLGFEASAGDDESVTLSEWQGLPIRSGMAPEVQSYYDAYVASTGRLPPPTAMGDYLKQASGLAPDPKVNPSDPEVYAMTKELEAAKTRGASAIMVYREADTRRNAYQTSINALLSKSPQELTPDELRKVRQLTTLSREAQQAKAAVDKAVEEQNAIQMRMSTHARQIGATRGAGTPAQPSRATPQAAPQPAPQPSGQPAPQAGPGQAGQPQDIEVTPDLERLIAQAWAANPSASVDEIDAIIREMLQDPTSPEDDQP
jgi:hypothetical protein